MSALSEMAEKNRGSGRNKQTVQTSSVKAPAALLRFATLASGVDISIVNGSRAYSPDELTDFVEMLQVLMAEGKVGSSGVLDIATMGKM